MIQIQNVTKRFDGRAVLSHLSLDVGSASVYGLIGSNGAGKTTLLKCAAGVYRCDGGSILLDGAQAIQQPSVRTELAFVPDDLYFPSRISLRGYARFYASYHTGFSAARFERLAGLFQLDPSKRVGSFSKGMKRQAALITALSCRPKWLLLDESFDGLDPASRNLVKNLLLEYLSDTDGSVLVSSHNLSELTGLCDHLALIAGGGVRFACDMDEAATMGRRFQLVFDHPVTEALFQPVPVQELHVDGRVATLAAVGDPEKVERQLLALSPISCVGKPMSIEEIFLCEMGGKDYDLSNLFEG